MANIFVKDPRAHEIVEPHYKISNWRGFYDIAWRYAGVVAIVALADHCNNPFVTVACMALIGGMQAGILNLEHDAWHYLCFTSKRVNDFAGSWLLAYPFLVLYYYQQVRHRGHHAYFGTMKDPDRETYVNENRDTPLTFLISFGKYFFAGILFEKVFMLAKGKFEVPGLDLTTPNMPNKSQEFLRILLTHAIIFALFFAFSSNWWNYFLYWVIPLFSFTNFFGALRQFIEHAYPYTDDPEPENRLNEFHANFLERFFICPINFHLHAFHHHYPKVPHYRLRPAKQALAKEGITYSFIQRGSYVGHIVSHIRALGEKKVVESKQQA